MEADIIKSLQACKLSEEEESITEVLKDDIAVGLRECLSSVYVKVQGPKTLNFSMRDFFHGYVKIMEHKGDEG
ncbi:hypothetical protein LIER_41039 [Lithospermum erythrorhizon]|uniref:Uncharacterized protein n=1 Tax=Lithospermum erythrorhizon TaxID=34254 RepID=A0AAV3R4I6_LITER